MFWRMTDGEFELGTSNNDRSAVVIGRFLEWR
jgi:hypothetical protein